MTRRTKAQIEQEREKQERDALLATYQFWWILEHPRQFAEEVKRIGEGFTAALQAAKGEQVESHGE